MQDIQQRISDGAREVKELDNQIIQLQQLRDNVSLVDYLQCPDAVTAFRKYLKSEVFLL